MERIETTIPSKQIIVNTHEPEVGDIAIFDYNGLRHFAYVKEELTDGWVRIEECNMRYLYGAVRCGERNISPATGGLIGYHDVE